MCSHQPCKQGNERSARGVPASTYCLSRGHGLYFESPVPSKMTFMMARQVSRPAHRAMPRVGNPNRQHCGKLLTMYGRVAGTMCKLCSPKTGEACNGLTYQVRSLQGPYGVVVRQNHAQVYVCCSARALQQHHLAQEARQLPLI